MGLHSRPPPFSLLCTVSFPSPALPVALPHWDSPSWKILGWRLRGILGEREADVQMDRQTDREITVPGSPDFPAKLSKSCAASFEALPPWSLSPEVSSPSVIFSFFICTVGVSVPAFLDGWELDDTLALGYRGLAVALP